MLERIRRHSWSIQAQFLLYSLALMVPALVFSGNCAGLAMPGIAATLVLVELMNSPRSKLAPHVVTFLACVPSCPSDAWPGGFIVWT